MSFIDQLLQIIAPHQCIVCSAEGSLLCKNCSKGFRPAAHCYDCHKLLFTNGLCANCRPNSPLNHVYRAVAYHGAAKHLVWKLKFGNTPAAAKSMAELMSPVVKVKADSVLVPVPTASSRIRQRGYNQADLLARQLSRSLAIGRADCLIRIGQQHQLGANRQQRLAQLTSTIRLKAGRSVYGRHIVLVDDVLTTGATLEACAVVLLAAGAAQIDAVVFAQA